MDRIEWRMSYETIHACMLRVLSSLCMHVLGWSLAHYHPVGYAIVHSKYRVLVLLNGFVIITILNASVPIGWIQFSLFASMLYLSASMIEWAMHRYIMHAYGQPPESIFKKTSKYHIIHHRSLYINRYFISMHIRAVHSNEEILFDIRCIAAVYCWMAILLWMVGVQWALQLNWLPWHAPWLGSTGIVLFYTGVWNTIHPLMHGLHNPHAVLRFIIPSLSENHIWVRNHAHHHITSCGQRNFNVVYLGMDPIMGTYGPIFDQATE